MAEISLLALCGLFSSSHIRKMTEIKDEEDVIGHIEKSFNEDRVVFPTVSCALPGSLLED